MDLLIDIALYFLIPAAFFMSLGLAYQRANMRLPEEFGHPMYAEVRELWGLGRTTLYENFMVMAVSLYAAPRVIRYDSIKRVGIGRRHVSPKFQFQRLGRRPFSPKFALVSIEYCDERGTSRLAQFQSTESGELLHVLAERLSAAGKGGLVTWPETPGIE